MNHRITAFLLVPLAGLFLLFHQASFQPYLAQGDHGRDLYAFAQAFNGQLPYRDYWWVYGPLMPYYYGLFFKIIGYSIPSILVGKLLLTVIAGAFIFFALSLFIPSLFAFIATLWFWMFQPDFFFTYNHIGGLTCVTGIVYLLFAYIKKPSIKYLWWALFLSFLLCLIKINFGLASLFVILVFNRVFDVMNKIKENEAKKAFTLFAVTVFPLVVFMIYWALFFGMPFHEIRQCLPYLSGDQPYHATPQDSLSALAWSIFINTFTSPANLVFALVNIGAILLSIQKIFSPKTNLSERKQTLTAFILLVFFYFVNLHEYILSGVLYRSFWATPFSTMMLFLILGYAVSTVEIRIQRILFGALFVVIFSSYSNQLEMVREKKIPEQFFIHERGRITTGNSEDWFKAVQDTSEYLQRNVPADQTFFALPYDPLYYYLADKKSPTRQLIFFEHINIPPTQERKIIAELEKNQVNFVVLSSRAFAVREPGLGVLGNTYCPILGKYLQEHFVTVAVFGDWKYEPGWAWNHGTQILKRVK